MSDWAVQQWSISTKDEFYASSQNLPVSLVEEMQAIKAQGDSWQRPASAHALGISVSMHASGCLLICISGMQRKQLHPQS